MIRSSLLVVACLLTTTASAADPGQKLDFNRDVRTILSDNCFKCHGFDDKSRQAGLRLDTTEGATLKLESGAQAIVPGDPDASGLIARLTSTNPDEVMPPPASGKNVTPEQIEILKRWIREGAEFKKHWSFNTVERPTLPAVQNTAWETNPIDRFALARLEAEGLRPSPEADKITLLRRLTLDLTGLPPTPAEVDAFLADTSPGAYEAVVDRLLKSPRYGEHMARYWLDLARYGDTHGLHLDNKRSLYKYREWVINAFNTNKRFDEFVVEQLGGDLLPNATLDQKVATGFVRANVSTSEGGSIAEEVRVRYVVDRTETLSTVFLGLTLGCAVCHDHKFDPVTQKEFYQLYSFFNSASDPAMDGNRHDTPPTVKLPSPEETARIADLDQKIAATKQSITDALAKVEYTEPPMTEGAPAADTPQEFVWIEDTAPMGAQLQGNTSWEFVGKPDHPVHSGDKATRREGKGITQHFFTGATAPLKVGDGDKFFAYVYLDPQNPPKTVMLQFNDGSWEHRAFWGEDAISFGSGDTDGHRRLGDLPKPGEWVRLEVDAARVGLPTGKMLNGWAFTQFDGLCYWDKAGIVTRTPQDGKSFESLVAWEAYVKAQAKPEIPQPVVDAIKVEADKRNDDQKKQIRDYFVQKVYPATRPTFEPLDKQLSQLEADRKATDEAIPVSLVMGDDAQERETFILNRGEYDKPGDKVQRGTPAVLPPMPEGAPKNRLGLAQWLVHRSHPLTSRVSVNRLWQQFFGRGLVKTSEDFGVQGEWPTHPELLDWLAAEFMETGWDVKRLVRMIVTSNTYRQSSRVSPELVQRDPENTLLARGPRFRMEAEVVRDSALFTSGLLVEKLGGRSVNPYQPEGIWEAIAFASSDTNKYVRDNGEALYRRSMYTFWKRTSPPPSMMAFDAPSRETCTARRARTNTPLQALVLMNDEQYVEAARRLAARMLLEGGSQTVDRLTYGFRLATCRQPTPKELEVLTKQLQLHLEKFQQDQPAALKLLTVGASPRNEALAPVEHAAYTMVANILLNLDETVTKE
ncbi:PSD1 and planctomycete cytochrome C domain-containing protein [Planctomyces sp. SH-PL14]|uniref:PSD1 and planctomycete cytochrome C domain-containing protein n=1 Tax=Planctomyces sp. SH-PL14 TaxID=1632864 RepID=UPI00078C4F39|nr:PSD1 and planctomycete cytochrome C domain-containing protein [Planctomyces sp. SH-PL14]AMV18782.1 Planctomycete cytochrome C [Planctomyces sp. SH-PL14]